MKKKTYNKYLRFLEALDKEMKVAKPISLYKIARENEVSTFLPTALRKLNFIVKRSTTSGYFWVWNLKGVTFEQIIEAVLASRARYDKQKRQKTKEQNIEEIANKPLKDITPKDLEAWEEKYKTQKSDATAIPIRVVKKDVINATEKAVKTVIIETPIEEKKSLLKRIIEAIKNLFKI
jgi:hypothetical protein